MMASSKKKVRVFKLLKKIIPLLFSTRRINKTHDRLFSYFIFNSYKNMKNLLFHRHPSEYKSYLKKMIFRFRFKSLCINHDTEYFTSTRSLKSKDLNYKRYLTDTDDI